MVVLFIICLVIIVFLFFMRTPLSGRRSFWGFSKEDRAEIKGKIGEGIVHDYLVNLPEEYIVLDNVILRTKNGTTQIDHIVVSKYGVFAIETKNYRGIIYGNDNRDKWKQIIKTPVQYKWYGKVYTYIKKSEFYNPVKQAVGHVRVIKRLLSNYPNLPVVPIVIFSEETNIDNVESDIKIIYFSELEEEIQSYKSIFLRDENVVKVAQLIMQSDVSGEVTNDEHVENVYRNISDYNEKLENNICPWCGGELVLRAGNFGRFYGCSNYPKCKFKLKRSYFDGWYG